MGGCSWPLNKARPSPRYGRFTTPWRGSPRDPNGTKIQNPDLSGSNRVYVSFSGCLRLIPVVTRARQGSHLMLAAHVIWRILEFIQQFQGEGLDLHIPDDFTELMYELQGRVSEL